MTINYNSFPFKVKLLRIINKIHFLTVCLLLMSTINAFSQRPCPEGGGAGSVAGSNSGGIGSGGNPKLTGQETTGGIHFSIGTLHAVDPNEIQGPIGITDKKWMAAKDVFGFIVRYENDPEFATGPAQKVLITVPIDPSFDINSIRVGNFGFGNMIFTVPPNSPTYYTRLDLRDSLGLYVDVLAGINITDHEAIFVFASIDPATGAEPLDPNLGFLPVRDTSINRFNDSIPNKGEGFVSFSIKPIASAQTGDTTKAQASIFFDINAPVLTNIERNTLDAAPPTSIIDSLTTVDDIITVHWSGHDDGGGVGIRDYGLYVSENGGAFSLNKKVTGHSTQFNGNPGSGYCFFILAMDSVGNQEALKTSAEKCLNFLSQGGPPSIDSVAITYTPLQNVSGMPIAPYYTNYPPASATTATIYRGDRFELSLKVSNAGNAYNLAVWVDYNNNNIFEAAENVILTTRTAAIGSDWAQIPLTLNAPQGKIRIRTSTDPITVNDYNKLLQNGETEDYTLSFDQVLNCRWIGRVSTNWHDPGNWSCGIVPDSTKSVLIPLGTAFNCEVINTNVTIDRLWIQPGATIIVANGRTLNITGNNATFTW